MKIVRNKKIYSPPFDSSWRDNSALTPSPIELDDDTIRVFLSFRDNTGTGRIGYLDLDIEDPSTIKNISENPIFGPGAPGTFDDSGVILGDVLRLDNDLLMFYVGFQKVENIKFYAFTGLAVSQDLGETFLRTSKTPIFDRAEEGLFIRAIHSVFRQSESLEIYYSAGSNWETINGSQYPAYKIKFARTTIGKYHLDGRTILEANRGIGEYRIGRPRVSKIKDKKIMLFTYGKLDGAYKPGFAYSVDNQTWTRNDARLSNLITAANDIGLGICYPTLLQTTYGRNYIFYCGAQMGRYGLGFCEVDLSEI